MENSIPLEISILGLPKKAIAVLNRADRLARHYDITGNSRVIHISKADYGVLEESLEKRKQKLSERVYRGYRLEPL